MLEDLGSIATSTVNKHTIKKMCVCVCVRERKKERERERERENMHIIQSVDGGSLCLGGKMPGYVNFLTCSCMC
jgi:hypothetical protein